MAGGSATDAQLEVAKLQQESLRGLHDIVMLLQEQISALVKRVERLEHDYR